ncbi:hypothetical protein [Pseudoxanthomonas dokdonensis]|nr:hypothetical protein [Pseudoxanthomonas dokdonensis]
MNRLPRTLGLALLGLCSTGLLANAGLAQTRMDRTRTSEFPAGSAEATDIRQWLQDHAHYLNGNMIGELDKLGTLTVTWQAQQSDPATPDDDLPLALPASGASGDRISISSCGSDKLEQQSWRYQWAGSASDGSWVLESYHYSRTSCATED